MFAESERNSNGLSALVLLIAYCRSENLVMPASGGMTMRRPDPAHDVLLIDADVPGVTTG